MEEMHFAQFPNLVRFELLQADGELMEPDLVIELRPMDPKDKRRLHLTFTRVGSLVLHPFGGFIQFSQLEVTSIEDWQWERYKYRVHEVEHDALSFYCWEYQATVVEDTGERFDTQESESS